jgi:hypothetical protein
MADAMSPESAAQGNTAASGSVPAENSGIGAVDPKMVDAMKKQLEAQSAIIRRLTEKMERVAEPKEEKARPKGPISTLSEQMAQVQKQLADERARTEKARIASAQKDIRAHLSEAGIDPALARMASETLLNRVRQNLQFVDDGTGSDVAVIAHEDGSTRTLGDYMAEFVQSDEGKAMAPGKPAPTLNGMPRSTNNAFLGKQRVTKADLLSGRVKTSDILAGKVVVVDAD